jgi:multidrug efflux pump subunit AcrB
LRNYTELIIEKNKVTFTIVLFFLVGGLIAYFNMPRAKDPKFTIHTAVITTIFAGATPARIESLVTIPLERQLRQVNEIDKIKSISKNGISTIYVDVNQKYKDLNPIWDKIRKKVQDVELPAQASKPQLDENYNEVFGTLITIVGEGFSYAELEKIANNVKEEILNIPDVGNVHIVGLQKQHIYIEFSNAKLAELGLSPSALAKIIQERNTITPGGAITIGPQRLILEPTGNLKSIKELGKTIIPLPGRKDVVYLEDIVSIRAGYSEPRDPLTRSNKEQSLILAVSVANGGNIIALGKAIKAQLDTLRDEYPIGVEFNLAFDEPNLVEHIIHNFTTSLITAIFIIMAVMLISLGWRTGLIVSSLIPSTILTSLFIMWKLDIGLNQVSLAALIISLGLLVDNAIVISESIIVKMDEGYTPLEAASNSVNELHVSLLTSSLTTAAAFLPIYLAQSVASDYTASLFEVVAITLISSWILALTIVPMLSYLFLKPGQRPRFSYNNPFCSTFKTLLTKSLKHRAISLLGIGAIFLFALLLSQKIPRIFFPPSEQPSMLVRIALPLGTSIDETLKTVKKMELFLDTKRPDLIKNYTSFVGKGAPRFWINNTPVPRADEYAEILVNATSLNADKKLQKQIELYGFNNFSNAEISVKKLDNGPPVKNPVQIRIIGNNIKTLSARAKSLKKALSDTNMVNNIDDNWGLWTQKLVVNINPSLAYHAGVSYNDIASSLQTALTGRNITEFRAATKTIPITMRSNHALKSSLETLENTLIFIPSTGKSVPLTQVASIDVVWKPPKIVRYNGIHAITVTAQLQNKHTAFDVKDKIEPWLKAQKWPTGYHYEFGGDVESSNEAQGAIADKLPITMMIIILLLILQFNSFSKVALIFVTVPLGIIGVIFGLFITNSYFGFMTYLGVISLIGIVINNAIILIERIDYELDVHHLSPQDAIIEAAQRRARPIILTTLTTIGGLIPLWVSGGPLWEPMAIAIIFGLSFATVLTLGVVPLFYAILFKVRYPKDYLFIYHNVCVLDRSTMKQTKKPPK